MNLSMKWLKEFVDIDINSKEFADAMTMSGSKVELIKEEGENLKNIVVGKIISIEKHPNADKLQVCQVDIGKSENIQIVTAAKNIKVNDLVPVALDNSTLADGTKIKKGKLRGVESNGMFCSIAEIGVTINDFPNAIEDGIFILKSNCKLGQDIRKAIGYNDTIIEFEITSNRPDCFSMIGLARETAATFNKPLKLHTPKLNSITNSSKNTIDISIENPELCQLYSARVVENVKVEMSPLWIRERLRAMGVRPINNIVDITNYVMLEYGQPMHAFDINTIEGNKIIVRRAQNGETITTLDEVERKLNNNDLIIADVKKPLAIAGVMGGKLSGITNKTTTIIFESANFEASSVRKTAKENSLRTDASSRYEKGLDPNNCIPALNRACELIEILNAGEVASDILIQDYSKKSNRTIEFNPKWINNFLGTNISKDKMVDILNKIGCEINDSYITVPSYRPDLNLKADIAEEIARFYGYNNIPTTTLTGGACGGYTQRQLFDKRINDSMIALGLSEVMTYSFISPKSYDKILIPENHHLRNSIKISNPLGEDTSIMRTTELPSILEILSKNYKNKNEQAHIFELAKEYIPTNDELPNENDTLIAGLYGNDIDFFYVKGIIEEFLNNMSIYDYDICASSNEIGYHPERCAIISINGDKIGIIGEIHPLVAENYEISCKVYSFAFDVNKMYNYSKKSKKYIPLPKFPSVTRDLCLICDNNMPVIEIQKEIKNSCGNLYEDCKLFDVYTGEQIEKGKKSVAFAFTLRAADTTLTDEQITSVTKKILKNLDKIGVTLRS